jgi:hypothetical protein
MAKKSKEFAKLLSEGKKQQKAMKSLRDKVHSDFSGTKFLENPKGVEKMSDILSAFISPYMDSVKNFTDHEKLLSIAVIAWNLALTPVDERQPIIDQAFGKSDPKFQEDLCGILDEMIVRKESHFDDHKRRIIEFQLKNFDDAVHLSVASI